MQSASSHNIDQHYYHRNQPIYASLDKASNSKDSTVKKSKPQAQELKALNSNNSLHLNLGENAKTSNKTWKEKKKHWR